jgi:hypothetical protein
MTENTAQTQQTQAENEFLKMLKLELQIMSMQSDMIKLKAKMFEDDLEK